MEEATVDGADRQTSRTVIKAMITGRTKPTAMNLEQQIRAKATKTTTSAMLMKIISTSMMAMSINTIIKAKKLMMRF